MAKVTYIEPNGNEHIVDVPSGTSVMQAAVGNSVRGIIGDCGGACSCATCHVYVDPAWIDRVGEKSESESALLEEVCDPQPNSRLSCQIEMAEDLDGLVVRLPAKQV
jgi:ferredoxin, 2Fe-2S